MCPGHTAPQQAASSLLVAIPLLSLVLPVAQSPCLVCRDGGAGVPQLARARAKSHRVGFFSPWPVSPQWSSRVCLERRGREPPEESRAVQAGLVLAAALLVLGADRYYSPLLLNPARASYMNGSNYGGAPAAKQRPILSLSVAKGLSASPHQALELLADWPGGDPVEIPWRRLPGCAPGHSGARCDGAPCPGPTAPSAFLAVGFVVCDMVARPMASFLSGAISNPNGDATCCGGILSIWYRGSNCAALVHGRNRRRSERSASARTGAARIVPVALL